MPACARAAFLDICPQGPEVCRRLRSQLSKLFLLISHHFEIKTKRPCAPVWRSGTVVAGLAVMTVTDNSAFAVSRGSNERPRADSAGNGEKGTGKFLPCLHGTVILGIYAAESLAQHVRSKEARPAIS